MSEPDDPNQWMQWRFGNPTASVGAEGSLSHRRYEFARYEAKVLALGALSGTGLDVLIFRPGRRVSLRTVLFVTEDDGALISVVGAHEPDLEVDLALPYALEVLGDRDLILVVPEGTEGPTLARLPWLDLHVQVFTHNAETGLLTEHPVRLRADVLDAAVAGPGPATYELSPTHAGWADEIIAWADGHPRLVPSHRAGYLAWQVEGRKVLEVRRMSGGKLRIAAGVVPGSSSPNATGTIEELDGPLANPHPIREAVRRAMAARLEGDDTSHLEHRFQARLLELSPPERLGLETFVPEFPAMRPRGDGYGRGFIDFLAVDAAGRLHVVETKVGAKESTVILQALDYWVWVSANRLAIAAEFGADPDLTVGLAVVVLPTEGRTLHRHNTHVVERLVRSVPLTVWTANADLDGQLRLQREHIASYRSSQTWSSRMRRRAIGASSLHAEEAATAADPTVGLADDAAWHARNLAEAGGLHAYAHLPHSSQRFALELFSGLGTSGTQGLLTRWFGPMKEVSGPRFEWSDAHDTLRESTADRPNRTTVDVFLDGETIDGRRVAALIEVKLTETGFGSCSHAEVAPAEARSACTQPGPFGGAPETCWQLRNRDNGPRRRYDQHLRIRPDGLDSPDCWFRESNQPMRNAALAGALVDTGRYHECKVALTVPQGHVSMRRRWAEIARTVEPGLMELLDPELVLGYLWDDDGEITPRLIDRYGVGPPVARSLAKTELDPLGWQLACELLAHDPQRLRLLETHPGGGQYDCLSIYHADAAPDTHVHMNLEGRVSAFPAHGTQLAHDTAWEALATGRMPEIVEWCEGILGRRHGHELADPWFALMPRVASRFRSTHRWRNGLLDTSGYGGGARDHWFVAIPEVDEARKASRDYFLQPETSFWFLVRHDEAADGVVCAVDLTDGRGWHVGGRDFDLTTADAWSFENLLDDLVQQSLDQAREGDE